MKTAQSFVFKEDEFRLQLKQTNEPYVGEQMGCRVKGEDLGLFTLAKKQTNRENNSSL